MIGTTAALIGSAVISGGAALFGASQQSKSQDKATGAQVQANRENIAFQKDIFNQQKALLKPWRDVGASALKDLQGRISRGEFDLSGYGYDDLIKDPGYQFRKAEGNAALDAAAAARGKLVSGDQLRGVAEFNQELASQEFNNAYNRSAAERDTQYNILSDQAGRGYQAAAATSGVAGELGSKVGTSLINTGNAIATGAVNQGNIWANFGQNVAGVANQGISNMLLYNRLQQLGI